MMPISALYAALLAPLFILLSVNVIEKRRTAKVAIGHGDDALLLRAMRVQANFSEYVPFALICLALAESLGTTAIVLHGIGALLLLGRHVHAYGVSRSPETFVLRVSGMVATFTAIALAALACLVQTLPKLLGF